MLLHKRLLISHLSGCSLKPTCFGSPAKKYRKPKREPTMIRISANDFSIHARNAAIEAQNQTRRLSHHIIQTNELLLGLLIETDSNAARLLNECGVTLDKVREKYKEITKPNFSFASFTLYRSIAFDIILNQSLKEAEKRGHTSVGSEHILLAMLGVKTCTAVKLLKALIGDLTKLEEKVLQYVDHDSYYAGPKKTESAQNQVDMGKGASIGEKSVGKKPKKSEKEEGKTGSASGGNSASGKDTIVTKEKLKKNQLREFCINLTEQAFLGKLDPVVGRRKQIERVIQILTRRTKNNPCLVGEPGVGKTAVVEGLAQLIKNGDVPDELKNKEVYALDVGRMVAGTRYRGDLEKGMVELIDSIKAQTDVILFIDELHTIIGASSKDSLDCANMMKPALARGELHCIGATTYDEYTKYIEEDMALERRFQSVKVPEPSPEETVQILRGLRKRFEVHHKLRYTDEALLAAAKMSSVYITERFLPDKAIDLIDEAASLVRLRGMEVPEIVAYKPLGTTSDGSASADKGKQADFAVTMSGLVPKPRLPDVTEADIATVVANWTGIPVEKVSGDETERLLKIEEVLHKRIIGQEEAVSALARAMRRARAGIKNTKRPIASFMFAGPTGVGKTELAKSLATHFFGSEESMIRLDMSEYMESFTVTRLIGSPPGYVGWGKGGQLTQAVRKRPYTVVLFDEIEKAHKDVLNILLQILEDGHLTDARGHRVSFKSTIIILTSNVGAKVIERGGNRSIGFFLRPGDQEEVEEDFSYGRMKTLVQDEMKLFFRPEFLNRLDDIVVFRQLTRRDVRQIADIFLSEIEKRMLELEIKLQVTERFKEHLVAEGFDPLYGARPLRRAIVRLVEDCLSERLLTGDIKAGDTVTMNMDDDGQISVVAFKDIPEPVSGNDAEVHLGAGALPKAPAGGKKGRKPKSEVTKPTTTTPTEKDL